MLVQPPLPAAVGAREAGVAAGGPGDGGVACELAPVVVGDGAGDALEAVGDAAQGPRGVGLGLAGDGCREEQPGPARKSVTKPPRRPAPTTVSPSLLAEAGARVDDVRTLFRCPPCRGSGPFKSFFP